MSQETETLVSMHIRFPTVDRRAVADQMALVMKEALAAGGTTFNLGVQPYDPDEDEDLA